MTAMKIPMLKPVVHINFIGLQSYFQDTYKFPLKNNETTNRFYYDKITLNSHMFRGNDSSMNFYNQFIEETVDSNLRHLFDFLPSNILDIVFYSGPDYDSCFDKICKITPKEWAEAYIFYINKYEEVLVSIDSHEQNDYYVTYFLQGIYASLVMSTYQIRSRIQYDSCYWYFSW